MKRWIHSATANNGTVIRMVVPYSTIHRSSSYSNEMIKLELSQTDIHNALALAHCLNLGWLDPHKIDRDANLGSVVDPDALSLSDDELIESLNMQDVGSGEPIIFSVRVNGKLVYSSGLRESDWGKMPNAERRNSYLQKAKDLFNSLKKQAHDLESYGIFDVDVDDGFLSSVVISRVIPLQNSSYSCRYTLVHRYRPDEDASERSLKSYCESVEELLSTLSNEVKLSASIPGSLYMLSKKDIPRGAAILCYPYYRFYPDLKEYVELKSPSPMSTRRSDSSKSPNDFCIVDENEFTELTQKG